MQVNPGPSTIGRIAWDGAAAKIIDISNYVVFGWTFEVVTDIAVDAVFTVQFHDGTLADKCVPDTAQDVPEVATCAGGAAAATSTITIPAGTVAGTICSGTVPCRNGRFFSLVDTSGDTANVEAVMVMKHPKSAA